LWGAKIKKARNPGIRGWKKISPQSNRQKLDELLHRGRARIMPAILKKKAGAQKIII
jgi:hypothetical protein